MIDKEGKEVSDLIKNNIEKCDHLRHQIHKHGEELTNKVFLHELQEIAQE